MADPSGAPPQPGPNDTATAILRTKKSYGTLRLSHPRNTSDTASRSPHRLIVDEATSDDNSGRFLF